MAVKIRPRKLQGPWANGFALDVHTIESRFLGYNAYGRPEFDTERSAIGELVYRLKNRGDRSAIAPIVDTAIEFLKNWRPAVDTIVPVPPSNTARKNQPVIEVSKEISAQTGIPFCTLCLQKVKSTAQLKNIFELAKRHEALSGVFSAERARTAGKRLLVFDDLYRSGATAQAATNVLFGEGGAFAVYLLTLTQTRKNL